ncbi:MAG: IS66 family transposase [Candidatus Ratteibacteria bacterium]
MEEVIELARKDIEKLRAEIKRLNGEKQSLKEELNQAVQAPCKRFFKKSKKEEPAKKKGAPIGHQGRGRQRPERIDQYVDIWPDRCNYCGCQNITVYPDSFQEHIVEDIQVKIITTSYRTHYGYCHKCKRTIYPKEEASAIIPKSRIGPNARAISGYFHYLGSPYRKIKKIFNHIFGLNITHPTLLHFDGKMAKNGEPLYQQIKNTVRLSPLIHADETGWPLDGENAQLWEFINKEVALYRIEKSKRCKNSRRYAGKTIQWISYF